MSFFAYILISEKDSSFYKGSCEHLQKRFADHNAGRVRSTKAKRPWQVHYYEEFQTKKQAIRREKFFKSRSGYRWLKQKGIL